MNTKIINIPPLFDSPKEYKKSIVARGLASMIRALKLYKALLAGQEQDLNETITSQRETRTQGHATANSSQMRDIHEFIQTGSADPDASTVTSGSGSSRNSRGSGNSTASSQDPPPGWVRPTGSAQGSGSHNLTRPGPITPIAVPGLAVPEPPQEPPEEKSDQTGGAAHGHGEPPAPSGPPTSAPVPTVSADPVLPGSTPGPFSAFSSTVSDQQIIEVLIAEGTGIAPYRAFVQQLIATGRHTPCWLVFSEQRFEEDFLYQLTFQEARDQAGPQTAD